MPMAPLLLWLFGCAHTPPEVASAPPGHLTVLHTNDLHAHFLPEVAEWIEGRPSIGGMNRLSAEIETLRAERKSTLLLDGGDICTGTPLSDLVVKGAKCGAMLDFLGALNYDAFTVGNHEFDKGLDNLMQLAAASPIPLLSTNLRTPDGAQPLLENQEFSKIFTVNGIRVGVIGAITPSLPTLMRVSDLPRLQLMDLADSVQEQINTLDPVTDLIVLLTHIGVEDDEKLARDTRGIDLIVGGHSHTRLSSARNVNGTWIVQAGSYARLLGVVDLVVENDAIATFSYELRELRPETQTGTPAPAVSALVSTYEGQLNALYGQVIAQAPALLGRNYHHESALGRWITDALRDATGADVAFYNGGGLRADIEPGEVTTGDIFAAFPFSNEVMLGQFTGKELMSVIVGNMAAEAFEKRGFLSTSGLVYSWRMKGDVPELIEARINGALIEEDRLYTIATNSYIAEQWEKFFGFPLRDVRPQGTNDFEIAVEYAKKTGRVEAPADPRAQQVK